MELVKGIQITDYCDQVRLRRRSAGSTWTRDPQDTLFGAGGSFRFAGAETLELYLGSGGDTVVAQAERHHRHRHRRRHPGGERPDAISADLAGDVNPVFTPDSGFPAGTFTADNRRPLHVAFFESVTSFVGAARIVGCHLFYNNSGFDGGAGASDDDAIAFDKAALLPGEAATPVNFSSYSRGINGIMVDVFDLPSATDLTADDFELATGVSDDPAGWTAAPAPSSISVRRGAGPYGSDRVTLVWPDGAINNTWLRVAVLATAGTGLVARRVLLRQPDRRYERWRAPASPSTHWIYSGSEPHNRPLPRSPVRLTSTVTASSTLSTSCLFAETCTSRCHDSPHQRHERSPRRLYGRRRHRRATDAYPRCDSPTHCP